MGTTWFVLTLAACIFLAVALVLQRIALREKKVDDIAFIIYFQLLVGLIILPVALLNFGALPVNKSIWYLLVAAAFAYAFRNVLFYRALKNVEVSQVSIIATTQSLWAFAGGGGHT